MQDTSIATPAPARRRRKPAAEAAGTTPRRRRSSGAAPRLRQLPINYVGRSKLNPRTTFRQEALDELAESIRQSGILEPLLVRPTKATAGLEGERYEIIAGERRWRAAHSAGLMEVPAIVREMSDVEVMRAMIVENVQRDALTPLEECNGYRALLDADPDATADTVAAMVGRSKSWVYQRIQLAKLAPEPLQALQDGDITAGHAVEIARLEPGDQRAILRAAGRGMSVSRLQDFIVETIPLKAPEGVVPISISWDQTPRGVLRYGEVCVIRPPRGLQDHDHGPTIHCSADECEHAVDALVVLGRGRGTRLRVCQYSSRCETHWSERLREKEKDAAEMRRRKAEGDRREKTWQRDERRRERWRKATPDIADLVARGTWDVDAMISAALDAIRTEHRHANLPTPEGLDPLHELAWHAVTMHQYRPESMLKRARMLGITVRVRGDAVTVAVKDSTPVQSLAEAPGSRTQPPRASGERPVLKTGRATGPHSLPCETREGYAGRAGIAHCPRGARRQASAVPLEAVKDRPARDPSLEETADRCRRTTGSRRLALEQANFAGARALLRLLGSELDALTLAQELEHRAAHRAAVEEVLDAPLVADEPETLVDQQTCDSAARHAVPPRERASKMNLGGHHAPLSRLHPCRAFAPASHAGGTPRASTGFVKGQSIDVYERSQPVSDPAPAGRDAGARAADDFTPRRRAGQRPPIVT